MSHISGFTPIWGNHRFSPGRGDLGFKLWAERGISKVMDTYNDKNILYSFEDLQRIYNIPRKHFFKYLQVRNYILTASKQSPHKPPLSSLEKAIQDHLPGRGQVSFLHEMIVDASKEASDRKALAWSSDFDAEISQVDWKTVCQKTQSQTINTRLELLQFRWFMRTYITPARLHRFDNNHSDFCIKCSEEEGTLLLPSPTIRSSVFSSKLNVCRRTNRTSFLNSLSFRHRSDPHQFIQNLLSLTMEHFDNKSFGVFNSLIKQTHKHSVIQQDRNSSNINVPIFVFNKYFVVNEYD